MENQSDQDQSMEKLTKTQIVAIFSPLTLMTVNEEGDRGKMKSFEDMKRWKIMYLYATKDPK